MMIRNVLVLAATLMAFAVNANAKPVEITWWHAMGGKLGETVNAIAKDFNASQSDYVLTPIHKGSYEETMTAGIAAFRAKQPPHIIQIFDAGAATIINAKGAVKPVADLMIENGHGFNSEDYISGVRYFYADADGKMIGMPFNSSTPVLYYNKAALAKAGVDAPKTWEDFEQAAPKLKAAGYTALAQSHMTWIFSENFHSRHNLPLADKANGFSGLSSAINYNNPNMIFHFNKLKDWHDKGYFAYYGRSWSDNQTAFEKEEVAMWLGSSGSFGGLLQKAEFEFGTTFLPYWERINPEAGSTFIGGAALFVMAGHESKEYQGAAEFFKFLTKAETQFYWHKETGYVPITNAAYELAKKSGYYDERPDAEVGIQQLNLRGGEWAKGYRLGYYVQIRDVMNREYDRIFANEISVEDAFAVIQKDSNKLLERFARTVK